MHRLDQRRRRILRAAAPVAGLLAAGLLVWQGSYAAFSATTDNNGNSWASGNVVLKNDGAAGTGTYAINSTPAAFTVSGMKPGDTGTKCIVVESSGSLASSEKLYTASVTNNALTTAMTMRVELDTTGAKPNCTGFTVSSTPYATASLNGLATASAFASGLGTWAPAGGTAKYATYRFTWALPAGATNAAMGLTGGADFIWEAQNT